MPAWHNGQRPLTLAILAMGGEGGGVLADWIVAVAEDASYYAQATSVAGVAQRTGATVYYVELFPPSADGTADGGPPSAGPGGNGRGAPVLSVFPTPGEVDIVIASELMEAGRAVQRGFSTPDRTLLIASTNRVYSIDEKMAMGDGRVDSDALLSAAKRRSKRLISADFMAMADEARSVISAPLFGALAGSGALPFTRGQFERQLRAFGKGAEQSLRAFAAGFDAAVGDATGFDATGFDATGFDATGFDATGFDAAGFDVAAPSEPAGPVRAGQPVDITIGSRPVSAEERKEAEEARRNATAASDPGALVGPALRPLAAEVTSFPAVARSMILHGLVRTAVYQDLAYARRYLDRVGQLAAVDPEGGGDARLTVEAARQVALWMCYQDTIQVALQKTRQHRMSRIRDEARAEPGQLIRVREFLHPRVDEITDTLPSRLGAALRRSSAFQRLVGAVTGNGMIVTTSSITGYTALAVTARLRPLRPRSLRFGDEQAAIDQWVDTARSAADADAGLAREILACQGVLKGYGATHARGQDSFAKLMRAAAALSGRPGAAARLARLREAALADENGATLEAELALAFSTEPSYQLS
jgi:indolepyruvate ferredoxin oxidoreductase beta subunit